MKPWVREMADVFKALGDPTRLRIIRLLVTNPSDTLNVSDLADRLGMTQPAVSQHIKVLKNVGILVPNKQGYHVFYHVNMEVMLRYIEQTKMLWDTIEAGPPPCDDPDCENDGGKR